MSEEYKKIQKHLVDEMMKVSETNPDVMLYMQSLMENYERLKQENKQLKEQKKQVTKILKGSAMFYCEEDRQWLEELFKRILEILGDKE